MSISPLSFHTSKVPALDGIRGIAILLVLAVHTTPILLPGGRIGVDLFFVLSGFLITSILLQEIEARGSLHLGYFYMRRVLRLAPAMITVVAFVILFELIVGTPQSMSLTLWNALGVIFYFFNWQVVSAFPDYLEHQWMFSHMWSLSVEEQFYILWPITIIVLFIVLRIPPPIRLALITAGILIPSIARAVIWNNEPSLSVYFRTDLRFDGLMWGALAAVLLDARIYPTERFATIISRAAVLSLFGLLTIAWFEGLTNGFLYLIGFSMVGLFSAILIYSAVVCPHPLIQPTLEWSPLCWVGKISYGVYLWHWPIIRAFSDVDVSHVTRFVLEFGVIFTIATLSYYFMEQPILKLKDQFIAR